MIHPVRKPTRLRHFDYASCGMYFVTICVQHMESRFGYVVDGEVALNDAGAMIASTWGENIHRYRGSALDAFVVMPNHLHSIVFIGTDPNNPETDTSLNKIVQSFKSISTVEYARDVRAGKYPPFDKVLWQRGYHDRIFRNDRALDGARAYIEGNPGRWMERMDR